MRPHRLRPKPPDEPHLIFHRGKTYPRANAWYGFSSFWGHLFHLAASVIATEDIDARDWMHALDTDELTDDIARLLGASDADGGMSLTEQLDDDLWVDFIADTGDDADVSAAVADMLFRAYRLPKGEKGPKVLPRGRLLVFGGDTAYPVATDLEIHNRVSVPFNRVLQERADEIPRILLGIPGNHDWYDGLDGFARMFRARRGRVDRASMVADVKVDKTGQIGHLVDWVEAFRVEHFVAKRSALPLLGYVPVQSASYFALSLAPALDLWGADRQLRAIDYTQRSFFMAERRDHPNKGRILVIADPAHTMLEPYAHGQRTLAALGVDLEKDGPLVLTGDTHHYCRQRFGDGLHIVAGGGGAFLHPARINRRGVKLPEAEFPGPRASTALLLQVPWQLAYGRAGFIVHVAVALLYFPIFGLRLAEIGVVPAHATVGAIAAAGCAVLAGWRKKHAVVIVTLAVLCGAWITALPYGVLEVTSSIAPGLAPIWLSVLTLLASTPLAVLGFGTFLMILTLLGLEHNQAYSSLAHPGYKHFMRLRVRRDGSGVDGWVVGKTDPLDPDAEIVLVDRWTWNNPAHGDAGRADREKT